jgi:uncharacterized protein YjbI with pentapeptide repeats
MTFGETVKTILAETFTAPISGSFVVKTADKPVVLRRNGDARRADLTGVNLSGLDLRGIDLSGAKLLNANLSGTDFTGANLSGADFTGAVISDAKFENAKLDGAINPPVVLAGLEAGI